MGYDFRAVELKWQERWEREKRHEAEPDERKKFFITVAWPYPSGPMHVGHARTYTFPDVIARYKRLMGYNVLFPMGWHLTGSPIVGAVNRLKSGEEKFLGIAKNVYGMSDEDLGSINDPMDYARYFIDQSPMGYKKGMRSLGLSIDWSKEFTSITPSYSREVEWQYRKFLEKRLVTTGSHPVKFCPHDNNPVTDHDLLEGEGVDIQEFFVIEYEVDGEDLFLPAATLRPETIFGVTNLWLKRDEDYVVADVEGKKWLLSREAVRNISYQKSVKPLEERNSGALEGKKAINPITRERVPIICADFVQTDVATGVVGSVPAHAPYDLVALKGSIPPRQVIEVAGYSDIPAKDLVAQMGIRDESEREKLDEATRKLYRDERARGTMIVNYGDFYGKSVEWAQKEIKKELTAIGRGDVVYEFTKKPVICRCGTECVVKLVSDQWFIRYSDEEWKKTVRQWLASMDLVPPETRNYFSNVIDWLRDWPFTRLVGMGTKVPWAKDWIIESLSDSTIYMSYYTIADVMREAKMEVDDDFFDYVFLSKDNRWKGNETAERAKKAFSYWYPLDYRVSASELIPNHLTFMIFHHTALFPEEYWPRGIISLGLVILEGRMMHSSSGIIYPVAQSVEDFGADATRFYLLYSVEPWQNFDWRASEAKVIGRQLQHFCDLAREIIDSISSGEEMEKDHMDLWLLGSLGKRMAAYLDSMENFRTRSALQMAFYEMMNDYRWYVRRGGDDPRTLKEFLERWIVMLYPFTPHLCDELWEMLRAKVPELDERIECYPEAPPVKEGDLEAEEYLINLFDDIKAALQALPIEPKALYLYCIPGEERAIDSAFLKNELSCDVFVQPLNKVTHDPKGRAKRAKKGKPAIYVEGGDGSE
jgi:leucyl-tRNA synthetase